MIKKNISNIIKEKHLDPTLQIEELFNDNDNRLTQYFLNINQSYRKE